MNRIWALAFAAMLSGVPAAAQVRPTSRSHFVAAPAPFEEARRATLEAKKRAPIARQNPITTPPEIVQLARALQNDPDLIYQYVHDNIEFSPLYGYLKGPVGTLLDGQGDAFDQSALMVALLNQASLTNSAITNVNFVIGQVRLSSAQLEGWLNVDTNQNSIGGILGSGGFPGVTFGDGGGASMGHVWVSVGIKGTTYVFDPAFKSHTWKTGIVANLPTIMGYTQSQFISDAGATVGPGGSSISNVNRTNLRSDLSTYANNLASYIHTNLPTGGVSDVLGGGTIVPTPFANGVTVRQTSNPNQDPSVQPIVAASIPSEYLATLSVTVSGSDTETFNSVDIYGHRLSIFFDSSLTPTMYLDGTPLTSGFPAFFEGDPVEVDESVNIPWFPSANQSLTQYVTAESNANGAGYVIATGWGQVGRGMIEKHRGILTQAINSGAASNSELVIGETSEVLGLTWLAECAAQQELADQLLGTATQYFYGGGIAGLAVGTGFVSPYVDLPLNFVNTPARVNSGNGQSANSMAAFLDSSGTSSSFESTVLEQTQAAVSGFTAASTVKLLDIALQNGDTIFDINNGTANDTVTTAQLVDYGQSLDQVNSYVNSGYRVIAPQHGNIAVGSWTGVGFKTMVGSQDAGFSYGEIISGGLSAGSHRQAGGFGGSPDPNAPGNTNGSGQPGSNSPGSNGPGSNGNVSDPIDRRKGSLQYRHTDISIGAKAFPYGLSIERSYDSGAQGSAGPFGNGWTHTLAIAAVPGSDGFTGMGQGTPLNAASSIVALYVSSDLVNGQPLTGQANLANFVYETVVNHWFTDQLTQNVVNVSQGWFTEEFVKMADGTYSAPIGSATLLDAPGGNFRYRAKAGITMSFNPSGQISTWSNAAGASVAFTYSNNLLATVANAATGRQLTFTYSGKLLSSVTDGSRTVSYNYTGSNLTSFTDALNQTTTYAYDTSGAQDTAGHLTQMFYPSNPTNAFVTTYFDSLGKVAQQADGNRNLTQAFFAGSRTEIDDPIGYRNVWYNDSLSNILSYIQDYGPSPHLNLTTSSTYDAQNNLLSTTMPEGNGVVFTYDALFNPLTSSHTPKPGSPLSPTVHTLTYTVPVASLPNFEEVQTTKDANNNITTYTYSSTTGTVSKIDQPSVTKPGAGPSAPEQVFTYTPIGLPLTSQDAEGRITRFQYDGAHAEQVTSATVDFGRLDIATQFGYDAFGDMNSFIDANGNTTNKTFDQLRRVTEIDGAVAGVVTKYTYFPDGQIQTKARQAGTGTFETTHYTYTLSDQVHTVTDPLGNSVTTTYDADDRRQTLTEQVSATQNRQRTYSYDALSRPYQVSDTTSGPGTVLETNAYTPNGRELSFTDANSHTTTYSYDGLDRQSQIAYPDHETEKVQYDANGNILLKTMRSGQTIGFTYDALNRIATKTPQGEAAGAVTYGYDLSGRLLQSKDASSATPYQIAYDTAGRANSFTDQQGRNTQAQLDSIGNRIRVQWPANTNGSSAYFVTYTFDALNRMTEIDANGSPASPLAKYQWDSLSRQTSVTYGDGTSDSYSQYDANDDLLSLTQNFQGGASATFRYTWQKDRQRQSTAVDNPAFQYAPAVDTTDYAAADADNAYTTVGGANLTYDGSHNLTYDGFNTLTYDVENRLVQAQNAVSGTIQYLYDSLGHRKQKLVNGVITQFVLVGNQEIADFTGAGVGTATMLTVRGVGGLPVAAITVSSGAVAYYHHDALGSTVAMTQSGTSGPAEVYTYSEFGMPSGGSFATYRYAGYRYDAETGLYYVRARYYSPQLGRFLQPDPIGFGGGRNLYSYVGNNPLNLTDSLGTGGWWNSLVNWAENHPVLATVAAVGLVAAAVAAIAFAPEIAAAFAVEEAVPFVFWSGGETAQAAAEAFALENGGVTIGMTEAGQELTALTEGMDWLTEAKPLWTALSSEFAAAASGDITAFISSAATADSIFFTTELGILLENEAVTSLTLIFF